MSSILREASLVGIISIGVTFVIINAGIDLSVGSILALVAMVCGNLLRYTNISTPLVLIIGIVVGILAGFINGFLITKLQIPDFIVTLATLGIYRGLNLAISKKYGYSSTVTIKSQSFLQLGGKIGGIYYIVIIFFLLAIIGYILLKKTRFGTYTYAAGASKQSAILSGVKTDQVKVTAYMLAGFTCAIAGIMLVARIKTATPQLGIGIEFDVIAAIVLGGCSLNGGRGDIIGTVTGVLIIGVVSNGLYQFHVSAYYQPITKGIIVLIIVTLDNWSQRKLNSLSLKTFLAAQKIKIGQKRVS